MLPFFADSRSLAENTGIARCWDSKPCHAEENLTPVRSTALCCAERAVARPRREYREVGEGTPESSGLTRKRSKSPRKRRHLPRNRPRLPRFICKLGPCGGSRHSTHLRNADRTTHRRRTAECHRHFTPGRPRRPPADSRLLGQFLEAPIPHRRLVGRAHVPRKQGRSDRRRIESRV